MFFSTADFFTDLATFRVLLGGQLTSLFPVALDVCARCNPVQEAPTKPESRDPYHPFRKEGDVSQKGPEDVSRIRFTNGENS